MGEPEDETFVVDLHFDNHRGGGYIVSRSTHAYLIPEVLFSCTESGKNKNGVVTCVILKHSKQIPTPNIAELIQESCEKLLLTDVKLTNVKVAAVEKWKEITLSRSENLDMNWFQMGDVQLSLNEYHLEENPSLYSVFDVFACLHARLSALETVNVQLTNRHAVSKDTERGNFTVLPKKTIVPKLVLDGWGASKKSSTPPFEKSPYEIQPVVVETYDPEKVKQTTRSFYDNLSAEQLLNFLRISGYTDAMNTDKEALDRWIAADVQRQKLYDIYKSRSTGST